MCVGELFTTLVHLLVLSWAVAADKPSAAMGDIVRARSHWDARGMQKLWFLRYIQEKEEKTAAIMNWAVIQARTKNKNKRSPENTH